MLVRRLFWPLLILIVFSIIITVVLPFANGWASHRLLTQLSQSHLVTEVKPYQWGYLSSEGHYQVILADQIPRDITIKVHQWGFTPSAVVQLDQQTILTSQWQWHPFSLSISGQHRIHSDYKLFQATRLNTQMNLSQITNQIAIPDYQGDLFTIHQFQFTSVMKLDQPKTTKNGRLQWKHLFQLAQLRFQDKENQFEVDGIKGQIQLTNGQPLSNYHTQLFLDKLHWRNGGLPLDLKQSEAQITMQASDNAITRFNDLRSDLSHWQEQLSPLVAHGLTIHIDPLHLANSQGHLDLQASLAINPTNIGHSTLDSVLLLQNSTAELHATADAPFLESIIPSQFMGWIEQGLQNHLIQQKGHQLSADLSYQRGELKPKS
ncbi:DUF945 family protein [Celerinatantimonas sp. YJH-8]|uniref:DUF945 family protein n=1 Tax=Celerinatantimonas sp. YJH-8 TaxID=3228714 RepID=UPI0038C4DCA2